MLVWRKLAAITFAILMTLGLASCGDTLDGFKQDSRDNAEAAGEAIEDAGEAIQDAVD